MRSVGFILEDSSLPRTVFYQRFVEALRRHRSCCGADADLVVPAEDTARETNWPRFGNPASAYLRGTLSDLLPNGTFSHYLTEIGRYAYLHPNKRVLVVNMDPFVRLSMTFKPLPNVIVADGSLAGFERAINPRTISMPALPMVRAAQTGLQSRNILASFQGAPSHPVRMLLAQLSDGRDFVIRLVDPKNYMGRVDAEKALTDEPYENLLDRSLFAFVPRGDAIFSYRLLEAMARGTIPVILSDGWVLPFDRSVDWPSLSITFHHDAVPHIPDALRALSRREIEVLQSNLRKTYDTFFADLDCIVRTLIEEAELLCR